ncbi:basic leucine zipper transcriptional factor ATF-like [Hyla sarda]|uniref:basic leucine zipper transcriptional factor ATF-like n=1 Tax=Hyla sarda TaxID=327740 RepID=UPI0024C3FF7F|nr:basic leucine zipper transcriptional factor ATF-like [Hyla sarda]
MLRSVSCGFADVSSSSCPSSGVFLGDFHPVFHLLIFRDVSFMSFAAQVPRYQNHTRKVTAEGEGTAERERETAMNIRETDMQPDSDSNELGYDSSPSSSMQDSSDDMKKVQRREKNRIAAQKSRQRQTQKADTLHVESEDLERLNAALRREIRCLREELKYLTCVLSGHQTVCPLGPPKHPEFPSLPSPHNTE